eukprot:CAMPEP_0202857566 /NCGR_PEP_ID=MMETSP1391-20130828/463_1 /ASSEMBLY_ACC=CAM_ASM_000867 /TAXON_ID=1034604 /ORGANISM="Chlamydomonas leiostraca, Strain SAG 11-49" /LENGTH=40 /DNA_ID= /DNA_START= /DNA_END= /DNA_ORIENTATION=
MTAVYRASLHGEDFPSSVRYAPLALLSLLSHLDGSKTHKE